MNLTRTCADCGCLFTPKHGAQELCPKCVDAVSKSLAPRSSRYSCACACLLALLLASALCAQVSGQSMLSIPGDGAVGIVRSAGAAPIVLPEDVANARLVFYEEDYAYNSLSTAVWTNKIAAGGDLVQATEVDKPIASSSGLYFNNTTAEWLSGSVANFTGQTFTVFAIYRATKSQQMTPWSIGPGLKMMLYGSACTLNFYPNLGSAYLISTFTVVNQPKPSVWCGIFNGANSEIYHNGVQNVTGAINTSQSISAGNTICIGYDDAFSFRAFEGYVKFFALYDRVLSKAEIESISSYLMNKYGITNGGYTI